MNKGKSILSFFSRVAENGKSSITEPSEKSIEMAALTTTKQESLATENSTHLSEGTALLLTTKQRNAHDKFAREIKETTGLLLVPAPCYNGRLTSPNFWYLPGLDENQKIIGTLYLHEYTRVTRYCTHANISKNIISNICVKFVMYFVQN